VWNDFISSGFLFLPAQPYHLEVQRHEVGEDQNQGEKIEIRARERRTQ
jgi:hypothetical protein